MMDFSERSEYVGANIKPDLKHSLQEYFKSQREQGNNISMSRWIEEAMLEWLNTNDLYVAGASLALAIGWLLLQWGMK